MRLLRQKLAKYDEPEKVRQAGVYPYFRIIESEQDTEVIINGKKVLMLGSNSYLGLTNHPKIKEAAIEAIKKYGTGCAGSRFLNGTLDIHIDLEERLAKYVGKDASLVYSTGFQVNIGVIPTVVGRADYLLIDKLDHASILEGCRLSFSKVMKYNHNDMDSLEQTLKMCNPEKVKLIIVDGVFSMDGDIADLPEICKLADKYNASVMVDDAHALGVIGENGAGTASHFDLTDKTDIIMGTFSKSLASVGGFVASDKDTIDFLKHTSRSLIFSASIPPASAATVLAALDVIESEPERREILWENTHYIHKELKNLGYDIGVSETPIIPVYVRDDMKTFLFTKELLEEGVFVNPVVSPAVDSGSALLRVSLMATHKREQIDFALEKFDRIGKKLGIIS